MPPMSSPAGDTRAARSASSASLLGLAVGTRCFVPDKRRIWVPVTVEAVDAQRQVATLAIDDIGDEAQGAEDDDDEDDDDDDDDYDKRRRNTSNKKLKRKPTMELSLKDQPQFPLQNAVATTPGGCEDMIELNHLHEAAILYNLKRRFKARLPYTFTGEICLALNPYQWLAELYTNDLHAKYLKAPSRKQLPPHVYAVSVAAYKHMTSQAENQSILVSGESGAGKTETTKILMDNLANISNTTGDASAQHASTIQRILDVNPLLESFGNAKTKRNDNSSRFGKFTQLQFQKTKGANKKMVLCGAKCETYLLEKTRVVTQETGERNYHIFYQIVHGATAQEKAQWGLEGGSDEITVFTYIEDDDLHLRDKDARNYGKTKHALGLLGLRDAQQEALFQTLAGILHLGQAAFEGDNSNEDGSHVIEDSTLIAAELLGLDITKMEKALCTRTMKAGGDVYSVPLNVAQATSSRDALAKATYSKIFDWMVVQINQSLSAPESDVKHTIGVLDIFGFESFVHNSFEQLCINYANEKLQQKFTQDVFKVVQEEYESENITWDHISYADNADVLALIEGKLGIIALLNEEIVRPKGNDEGFVGKLSTSFRPQKKIIEFPRMSRTQFTIHHYADSVKYEALGFLEKHKDALLPDLSELMRGSREGYVMELFEPKKPDAAAASAAPAPGKPVRRFGGGGAGGGGGNADSQTVGTQFKQSLNRLMDNINKTNVNYIRCIKPNNEKSTTKIDEQMVVNQLRCAGVIEAICIARAGYPNRMKHEEFLYEFDLFLTKAERARVSDARKMCVVIAKQFKLASPEEYQMGKTKIYLQQGVQERLETAKAEKLFAYVALIQSHWRRVMARRHYLAMVAALRVIQRRAHVYVAVVRFKRVQFAVGLMQRVYRGYVGRCEFHAVLCENRAGKIQRVWRGYLGRCEYHARLRDHRARKIQRVWRGYVGRCEFHARLCDDRARRIQRVWRGHMGRAVFHQRVCEVSSIKIQCAWRRRAAQQVLWQLQFEFAQEQERLRVLEEERQRQLELELQRERDEQERQRLLAEEAEAKALRLKLEREEQERREREEQERLEREELERLEFERLEQERLVKEEQARLEQEELERERVEQELREREERERREREEREEREEQERLEQEARAERELREREEREEQERLEQAARVEQERRERAEREERERVEQEERKERERAELASQTHAAVQLQRVARGGLARQKFAQLQLEDEIAKQKAEAEAKRLGEAANPVELQEARLENERLKLQLEELLEANIELETLTSEWRCEQDVLRATSHVQETDLKRQITQQKQKLETARGEYTTLCAYIDQSGGELPRPANDGDHPEENDTDSDNDSISSGEGDRDRLGRTNFRSGATPRSVKSPFMDDRTSSNVSSLLQRPTNASTRLQARKDVLKAGAKQLGRARKWVTKNAANGLKAATAGSGERESTAVGSASIVSRASAGIASRVSGSSNAYANESVMGPPTPVSTTESTADLHSSSKTSKSSKPRLPKFRWGNKSSTKASE